MLVHVYGESRAPEEPRLVFFHGYPGVRSKQNRDIAESLAMSLGSEAHVLLYSGLTQAPGEFSFQACMADVEAYLESILVQAKGPIDLVGHSWGGFLALNTVYKYKKFIRRLALMSPLLYFPTPSSQPDDRLRLYFEEMARENPALQLGRTEDRLQEFAALGRTHDVDAYIASIPKEVPVLFLQADKDEITPTAIALDKQKKFLCPLTFELVPTDHSFLTARDALAERLRRFFA